MILGWMHRQWRPLLLAFLLVNVFWYYTGGREWLERKNHDIAVCTDQQGQDVAGYESYKCGPGGKLQIVRNQGGAYRQPLEVGLLAVGTGGGVMVDTSLPQHAVYNLSVTPRFFVAPVVNGSAEVTITSLFTQTIGLYYNQPNASPVPTVSMQKVAIP